MRFIELFGWLCLAFIAVGFTSGTQEVSPVGDSSPFAVGEKVNYDIKKMGVKMGEASFHYKGQVKVNGQDALLMIFTSRALNFFDEEKIYFDPQTFYPIVVQRKINLWGKKEVITETYNAQTGSVDIVKEAKGKTYKQTIQKTEALDNIYCFIYRYRKWGAFKLGEEMSLNLPTANVDIKLLKKTKVKTGAGEMESYFMRSSSKKYKIWFGSQEGRIPLRIDGALGFGKTSLILDSYVPNEQSKTE